MSPRNEKLQEAIAHAAAEFVAREANRNTLITVTRAQLSETGANVSIFVSVYPESGEEPALRFLQRNVREFGTFLNSQVRGVRVPHIEFMIDEGEKRRRRLDELTN
jgi:ribosome-binding factor A